MVGGMAKEVGHYLGRPQNLILVDQTFQRGVHNPERV
jgi:hypothetical protein